MRIKTSISLPEEKLMALDKILGPGGNRSQLIERAIDELVARLQVEAREARDLEILDSNADELNREMEEVLAFQVES